jgi:hypothetical protein
MGKRAGNACNVLNTIDIDGVVEAQKTTNLMIWNVPGVKV